MSIVAGFRLSPALNQRVAGSNPARLSNEIKGLGRADLTLFCAGEVPVYLVIE